MRPSRKCMYMRGRFRILSDGSGRECKFGGGGDFPCKGVASILNLPYDMSIFENLQKYGIGPGMGYKRGVVMTVVLEDG